MREQPNGKELLAIARQVLKDAVIPNLPGEQRYNALMIANAMAIASRQFETTGLVAEVNNLQALLEAFPVEYRAIDWNESPERIIEAGVRQLISLLRAGQFDQAGSPALRDYLSLQVLQRVRESNPKALP